MQVRNLTCRKVRAAADPLSAGPGVMQKISLTFRFGLLKTENRIKETGNKQNV